MRKFYLSDGTNTFGLNGENGIWLINPSGLGVNVSVGMSNIGNGYFVPYSDSQFKQQSITGDILFTNQSYESYNYFVNLIENAENVYLIYSPFGTDEYIRKVYPAVMNKGELTRGILLQIPFTFNCLTPWYTEETIDSASDLIPIYSGGQQETTIEIECDSPSTNPHITVTDSDNNPVAELLIYDTVNNLKYSNNPIDSYVYDGDTDIISKCVINSNLFGRTKKNFSIAFENLQNPTIKVKRWYRSI